MTHSLHHRRRLTMHLFLGGMFRRILTACFERMFSEANSRRTRSVRSNFTKLGTTEDDEDEVYYDACSWSMDECHQTSQELICDKRRKISWGTVQVRTFPNIVGDNPEAKGAGPPLTLAWEFISEQEYGIDEYEISRQPFRHQRAMVLTGWARCEILRRSGIVDNDEMVRGIQHAILCRQQRRETILRLRFQRLDEIEEFFKSIFVYGRRHRE